MGTDDLAERALHQGLIKVAAAYVHAVRHNPTRRSPRTSPARAATSPPAVAVGPAWGVDVADLIAAVDARLADPDLAAVPPVIRRIPIRMNRPQAIPAVDPLYADIRRRDPVRPAVLLDVRERDEFATVRVEGSLFIPMSQLARAHGGGPARPADPRACAPSGGRSAPSRASSCAAGWTDVGNVAGGITTWERMGLPVRRGPGRARRGRAARLVLGLSRLAARRRRSLRDELAGPAPCARTPSPTRISRMKLTAPTVAAFR